MTIITTTEITKKPLSIPHYPTGKMELTLVDIRQETVNISTFIFDVVTFEHNVLRLHPGQAISLKIRPNEESDEEHIRTFTVAGVKNNQLELTIKKLENGFITHYMHSALKIGDQVEANGPFGEFSVVYYPNKPLLLIGAGSGLTPIMAMLRWLHERKEQTDVIFIQQSSTPNDVLFSDEVAKINQDMPNLTVYECVSRVPEGSSWKALRGRLNRKLLSALVPDLNKRTVLSCGPEGFTESIRVIYKAEGGLLSSFHTETFGTKATALEILNYTPPVKDSNIDGEFTVKLDNYEFLASPEQDIVQSAAIGGIRIPTSCREGSCGTCRVKLISGNVESINKGGLSVKEEENNYILACCSKPLSNLSLSRTSD